MEAVMSLPDVPDLTGIADTTTTSEPFENGWYKGTVLATRSFTDGNGNERVFNSQDVVSTKGDSRNIRLQVELVRTTDNRKLNVNTQVNYRPEDFSTETIQAVIAHKTQNGDTEWGPLFRSFMTLQRVGKLQRIANVRQFQRNGDGGLDLTPLYGKTGFFRIGEDDRNPAYKDIKDFSDQAPKRAKVL